jgi:hypothetical protein
MVGRAVSTACRCCSRPPSIQVASPGNSSAPPSSSDWRQTKGVVSGVKDQGQCGSCWAFATVEAIESQWVMAGHDQELFSTQQVISCDLVDGGCDGGDPISAYEYVRLAGGLLTVVQYPDTSSYTGDTGACVMLRRPTMGEVTGNTFATFPCEDGDCDFQDEHTMAANVAAKGPAAICVNANAWQLYVFGECVDACSVCGVCV